ncbi:low-density lipoprotein receptor-related protein 4-like isoform X5 [Liolophura sinensis]|uniref:low-density lipoprotein receptor-related protein 4-like isoform X2 n=1 Tax=Liolophura sinensis TaxID=3198878 RepID=UPI0031591FF5
MFMIVSLEGDKVASRLAVDDATGNIYFSANRPGTGIGSSYIAVVTPDGKSKKTLVNNLSRARAVALYSSKGLMFWTDIGFGAHVGRANMDGCKRKRIITTAIKSPNGIAIDFEEDFLFWSDGGRGVIERCSLVGADRQVLVKDPDAFIMALVIDGDKLYYTAWNRGGITVVNKADGSNKHFLMESPVFAELGDFLIVRPNKGTPVINQCTNNNGRCVGLCLPTPNGRTCARADRVGLQPEGPTCVEEPSSTTKTSEPSSTTKTSEPSSTTKTSEPSSTTKTSDSITSLIIFPRLSALLIARKWRRQEKETSNITLVTLAVHKRLGYHL